MWYVADAFRYGWSLDTVHALTKIDPWFLDQIEALVRIEQQLGEKRLQDLTAPVLYHLKQKGFSDRRLSRLLSVSESEFRKYRHQLGVRPVYKRIDTCASEFDTDTAYLYSTYEEEDESRPTSREKIIVLGGGPNRIGQGIEFDYCCVHAALTMRELGYESIMVNCNPETVSTDFDISDRLYFEPLTLEDVLEIVAVEKPKGVIVQYGGQTPLKLARALESAGVPVIGTSPDAIDRAEDRERFQQLLNKVGLKQPPNGTVRSVEEGLRLSRVFNYPLVVRPSYVLGGRAMRVVFNEDELCRYIHEAIDVSPESPLLLDHFLDDAIEVDIDAVSDGETVLIGGTLEHIEQAGVHSGDSSCTYPPHSLDAKLQKQIEEAMVMLAKELGVVGLINAQFAIQGDEVYVLEVNPRASRTVPFIAKASGVSLARLGAACMVGRTLAMQGMTDAVVRPTYFSVKQAIFPFNKFPNSDPILGPEMRSTGEVMGIADSFGEAFAKGQLAGGKNMPHGGTAFISVRDADKPKVVKLAKELIEKNFKIVATRGTAKVLMKAGVPCEPINKVEEGRPDIVDAIKNDEIDLIINTTEGEQAVADSYVIRHSAVKHKICYNTTLAGGAAACFALSYDPTKQVNTLQLLHRGEK